MRWLLDGAILVPAVVADHTLVLDGVFSEAQTAALEFHTASRPTDEG